MKQQSYDLIEKHLCKEVDQIAETINKNGSISLQDVEKLDKIYHTLKSMATYRAMIEAEDYIEEDQNEGVSGRRGRAMNGRFVSRSSGPNSYAEGYERGYSEASGHYPMPYYEPRRW